MPINDTRDEVPVFNGTSERIPPFGLMKSAGTHTDDGSIVVGKPDGDSLSALLVNSSFAIEAGESGTGTLATREILATNSLGGQPALSDEYGSESGKWEAKKGNNGFIVLSGFAGSTRANVVRVAGTGGGGGGGGGCIGCGWVAGLEHSDCLRLTVVGHIGRCGCIESPQTIYLRWNGTDGWESGKDLKSCCGHARVVFEVDQEGEPHLRWKTLDKCGGGTLEYDFTLDCCTGNIAWFTAGDPDLCSDDRAAGGPVNNTFRVQVEWLVNCPNEGYNGPGWYCAGGSGSDCSDPLTPPVAVLYTTDPGPGPVLCSGPYDTKADAEAVCPPDETRTFPWCDGLATAVPSRLMLTISGAGSLDGVVLILRHTTLGGGGGPGGSAWFGCMTPGPCGGSFYFAIWCDVDSGQLVYDWGNFEDGMGAPEPCSTIPTHIGGSGNGPLPLSSLSPFHFHDGGVGTTPCSIGAVPFTVDVVEP